MQHSRHAGVAGVDNAVDLRYAQHDGEPAEFFQEPGAQPPVLPGVLHQQRCLGVTVVRQQMPYRDEPLSRVLHRQVHRVGSGQQRPPG
ncbi:hypothetical protein ADL25_40305 [Streptomyces sp. NRRL F-5122]|nr:hypothetical protein ADL25_40305 [Streptomyces sp. NRRL F-5122]